MSALYALALARFTARITRRWLPQRHRFPLRACLDLVVAGVRHSCPAALSQRHNHAVHAVAALRRLLLDERRLQRVRMLERAQAFERGDLACSAPRSTATLQERTAFPSMITVHAPHWASPQPNRGPCRSRSSRKTYRSGVCGSASTTRVWLFTRSEIRAMAILLSRRKRLPRGLWKTAYPALATFHCARMRRSVPHCNRRACPAGIYP